MAAEDSAWLDLIANIALKGGDGALLLKSRRVVRVSGEMLGYTEAELLALPDVLALATPKERPKLDEALTQSEKTLTPQRLLLDAQTREGTSLPVWAVLNPFVFRGEVWTVAVGFDVSEIRRISEMLAQSESRFQLAFAHSRIPMSVVSPEGRFLRVNPALCEWLGYEASELLTLRFADVTHPDDLDPSREAQRALLNGERIAVSLEKRYRRKNGDVVWGELTTTLLRANDGTPLYFVSQIQDITARKEAEKTLALVTSSARCILWHARVRHREGHFDWNIHVLDEKGAQQILPLDVPPESTYTTQWWLSRLPEDNRRADEVGHSALLRGERSYHNEFRCRDRYGVLRWLSEDVYVEPLAEGEWRCVGVCTDVTSLKQAQLAAAAEAQRQASLARIAEHVLRERKREALLRVVLEEMAHTLNADAVTYRTSISQHAYPPAATSYTPSLDEDLSSHAQQPLILHETLREFPSEGEGFSSELSLSTTHGVLSVHFREPHAFSREETRYAETAANIFSHALEERRERQYAALQQTVAETLVHAEDVPKTLSALLEALSEPFHFPYGACWLDEPSQGGFKRVAQRVTSEVEPEFVEATAKTPEGELLTALGAASTPLWLNPSAEDVAFPRWKRCREKGMQTALFVPLLGSEGLAGMMEFYHPLPLRRDEKFLQTMKGCGLLVGEFLRRVRTQEALAEAKANLEKRVAERTELLTRLNADLEQFVYVAAHDLQTPLRNVTSFVQLLQRRYQGQLDARANEYIDFAVEGALHLQRLLHGLLAYANVGVGGRPFQWVETEEVFREALWSLSPAIRSLDARITNTALPRVFADRNQLVQVFRHLLDNALKFCRKRPEIHVAATPRPHETLFSISDNGIGIERLYWERIFVIFQRLHSPREYPGTGVGLSLCKRIVERHGGRIWVNSVVGLGTTVFFTIPSRELLAESSPRQP